MSRDEDACPWCEPDDDLVCSADRFAGDFVCTRQPEHAGQHIACGVWSHDLARWPRLINGRYTVVES